MNKNKPKVLFVEDEKSLSKAFKLGFELEGFEVLTAFDGAEGLVVAVKDQPDIILLDLIMPNMGGEEALCKLKENPETKDIPVVVFTNLSDEEKAREAISRGAFDYIVKSSTQLKEVIEKVKGVLSVK